VGTAGTATRVASIAELGRPRRVLLLSESAGLAAVLTRLLDRAGQLSRISSLPDLAGGDALEGADAVVLDVPLADRADILEQLRHRFNGPLVVLVTAGDHGGELPPDDARTLLTRPFSADDLRAALTMAAGSVWGQAAPVGRPAAPLSADPLSAEPLAPPRRRSRLLPMLIWLAQGWQARRRVRMAGFVGMAAIAFVIAFALAAQGRCGPGCDILGTGVAPSPTIPLESSRPPATVKRKAPGSTASQATLAGNGDVRGRSRTVLGPTSTTDRRVPTTTRASSGGTTPHPPTTPPTTGPPTTPPTTAPPTTAPPTTAGP
jgi:hypothetical protein